MLRSPRSTIFLVLASTFLSFAQTCPSKVSSRLCPNYSLGEDSTFLKVRIMLDPALWVPSKPEDNNPLIAAAKGMIQKYEFRTIEAPDSPYNPLFVQGGSPTILEVLYHNVLVRKLRIDSIIKEEYVKEIQVGCRNSVSTGLCDTFNLAVDSGWVKVFLHFQVTLEDDTSAMETYLSQYDTRNPENTSEKVGPKILVQYPFRGFAVSRREFEKMSADPEVHRLESWYKISTRILPRENLGVPARPPTQPNFTVNGRKIDWSPKKSPFQIIKKK